MDLSRLHQLKQKLHESRHFADVYDFFLTHLGEHTEFHQMGEPTVPPFLEEILPTIGEQLFGHPVPITEIQLRRIPEYGFVHGSVMLGGKMAIALYFEEIFKGVLVVLWSIAPPETKYIRFTGRALYDQLNRSVN